MVSRDPRSNTCKNLRYLQEITQIEQPELYSSWRVKEALPVQSVPTNEMWRLGLLSKLMVMKQMKYLEVKDNQSITAIIDSLCST